MSFLNIVADCIHTSIATVYPFSDGFFQQDNVPRHKVHTSDLIPPLLYNGMGDSHF